MPVAALARQPRLAAWPRPARQRGQALAFATITVVVVMLAMLVMVSSGQLATDKMRLQNTGDAAAYSGALALSRDYNFSAYTNRAMVANQVAVAQWVGMTSWARHNDAVFNGLVGALAPCITAMVGNVSAQAITLCANWPSYGRKAASFKSNVQSVAGASITALDGLMGTLSDAQRIYHAGTAVIVPNTVRNVISANDPQAQLSTSLTNAGFLALFANKYMQFSRTYDGSAELSRFADVTHRSLDVFSGSNDVAQRAGPVTIRGFSDSGPMRDLTIPGNGGVKLFAGIHTGGTELTADFKSWNALDVSSMVGYAKWFTGCSSIWTLGIPTCFDYSPFDVPLAWDGAYAGKDGPSLKSIYGGTKTYTYVPFYGNWQSGFIPGGGNYLRGYTSYGNAWFANFVPTNTQLLLGSSRIGSFSGLRPYQELGNLATDRASLLQNVDVTQANSKVPSVVIEVEKQAQNSLTTANMPGGPNGAVAVGASAVSLRLPDKQAGAALRVVAGAEVYFARPQGRSDGKVEWPSLFNPYWQARLRDTRLEAAASAVLQ